jgi:hypothetical protein
MFLGSGNPSLATGATVCRPLKRAEGDSIFSEHRIPWQFRNGLVEPVFGVLKEQRGMKSFRMRGEQKIAIEFAFAATAYNLTRMHKHC